MAKFVFKLQGILNIKEKLEEQEKIAYGNARIGVGERKNHDYKGNERSYYQRV